jgi:formate hydrogenlyase subunit 6/NADH:ubiquinone oxidoreductase subunit I
MAKDKGKAVVDYSICMACGVCVQACPFSYLELTRVDLDKYNKAYPQFVTAEKCSGCGTCKDACPVECIRIA